MTTETYAPPVTRASFAGTGMTPKLSFSGIVRSERIKLTSLRSFSITLAITIIAGVGFAFLGGMAMTSMYSAMEVDMSAMPASELQSYLLNVATSASPFLALIFGVLGVFAMSSEYSSGMILSSLAAVPRRTPMYLAKALVLTVISGVTALILSAAGLGIAMLYAPVAGTEVFSTVVVSGVLGTVAYLVLIALLGFGFATILRSTAGAIAVLAGLTFVLPIGFQILTLTSWEWVPVVFNYLPMSLGSTLAMGNVPVENGPTFVVALLAIAVWAAVPVILGHVLLKVRDAK